MDDQKTTMDDLKAARDGTPGLYVLASPPNPNLDIVAVHGLNGNSVSTWTDKSSGTYWLQHLLPQKMPFARVMTFQYDATAVGGDSPYGALEHAELLLQTLRTKRFEYEERGAKIPVVFIGHSLGGILIKSALRRAASDSMFDDIDRATKGIVFFGTPHGGSDHAKWLGTIANMASAALRKPKSKLVPMLQRHSEELLRVSDEFRPHASRFAIASFYEQHINKILGTVVVDKASAVMGEPHEDIMMMGGDHQSMCTFSGNGDPRFETVWRFIQRVSNGPVRIIPPRSRRAQRRAGAWGQRAY